jgi:AhpC/TSA family protein
MTTALTITGCVADLHITMAAQPLNEVMGAFRREQAGLAAAGPPDGIAPVGMVVADVDLLDAHGAATTLCTAAGDAAGVAVFYRGTWCPYCNIALATYQAQLLPQLTERGVRLLAISPQAPDGSLSMQEKNDLLRTPQILDALDRASL